jgi:hypothetical protein
MCREVCGPATNEPTHLPERAVELLVLVLELLERLVAREAAEDLQMGVVRVEVRSESKRVVLSAYARARPSATHLVVLLLEPVEVDSLLLELVRHGARRAARRRRVRKMGVQRSAPLPCPHPSHTMHALTLSLTLSLSPPTPLLLRS